jgi:hypothetical protein
MRWGRGEMMVLLLSLLMMILLSSMVVRGERPGGVMGAKSDWRRRLVVWRECCDE